MLSVLLVCKKYYECRQRSNDYLMHIGNKMGLLLPLKNRIKIKTCKSSTGSWIFWHRQLSNCSHWWLDMVTYIYQFIWKNIKGNSVPTKKMVSKSKQCFFTWTQMNQWGIWSIDFFPLPIQFNMYHWVLHIQHLANICTMY